MPRFVSVLATCVVACGNPAPGGTIDGAILDSPADVAIDAPSPVRHLGIEVDQPTGLDQGTEIALVKMDGVDSIALTMPWSTLEPGGSGFDPSAVGLLQFGMGYYRNDNMHVLLSIPVVDTVATLVPSDLAGMKLDSPAVIARAQALVEEVLDQTSIELEYLVVSNEVDINLADGTPTWAELDTLTAAMVAKAHELRPDVKVGISVTSNALTSTPPNADAVAALAPNDVAFVTYYNAGNFGTSSTAGVAGDLAAVLAATDRPVVLKEFGYATGSDDGGSEDGQATFVTDAFTAWDAHADRIPMLMYSRMFDGDETTCEAEAASYGLPGNQAFIDFLCTLGLRSYADQPKAAWATFTAAAQARTWGS